MTSAVAECSDSSSNPQEGGTEGARQDGGWEGGAEQGQSGEGGSNGRA